MLGWTAGQGSREALGALVLGEGEGDDLAWVGNVGSGLDERSIADLLRRMEPLRVAKPPLDPVPKMPKTPARLVTLDRAAAGREGAVHGAHARRPAARPGVPGDGRGARAAAPPRG